MATTAEAAALPPHLAPAASAALGRVLGDSPRVAEIRASAAALAAALPLPTSRERAWKYTDVSGLSLEPYTPGNPSPGPAPTVSEAGHGPRSVEVVDGRITGVAAGGGVRLGGSGDPDISAIIDAMLARAVLPDTGLFGALHYAFLDGTVAIHVAADAEIALPVRITRSFERERQLAAPHTIIVTGPNARVKVLEDLRSADADMLILPAVEIFPGEGAEVRYTAIHRWGPSARVFAQQRTVTAKDSAIVSLAVVSGGAVVKSHVTSSLAGRGSSSEIFGLFLGDGSQHFDLYTLQDHIAADTRSDLLYKSALRGRARSVYYGMTRVGLEARNADANQENRNLLLSKTARADSDPVLEIFTNDVIKAAHGATAGPVDEEQLFYLQARGLSRAESERLLVGGFLGEVLDRVPDEALRAELAASVGVAPGESL